MTKPLLEAQGLVKSFGKVQALRGADFTINAGEIVALVGDNGAGKSTLVKVLSGVHSADKGRIMLDGEEVTGLTPVKARELGMETVYQDLALAPTLDPVANLFLGREILRPGLASLLGFLDKGAMRSQALRKFAEPLRPVSASRASTYSVSGSRRRLKVSGRPVADLSIPRICCLPLRPTNQRPCR